MIPSYSACPPSYPSKMPARPAMRLLFALGLIALSPCAFAASFDCHKAASATEKLICSDAETSALDGKLEQAYKTALAAVDASDKKALAKEQRNWIRYNRDICQDRACLRQVYTDRIAVLARNEKNIENEESQCVKPGGYQNDLSDCGGLVETYRDPNDHIDSFNQTLVQEKQRGRIIGCSRLIALSAGTSPIGPEPGNQNFGGYCVLQNDLQRRDVMICNDTMIGNFQVQSASSQDRTDKHLIDFTYTHCYEGR